MPDSRESFARVSQRPGLRTVKHLPINRLFGYYLITAITALSPLAILPAITATNGAAGFSAIALGQASGLAAALVISMGWGLIGPHAVATQCSNQEALRHIFWESLASRLIVAAVAFPISCSLTAVLTPDRKLVAVAATLASGMAGLSNSWFFVGLGRMTPIALYETIPQVASSILAALLLATLKIPLLTYPLLNFSAWIITVLICVDRLGGGHRAFPRSELRLTALSCIRDQWRLMVSALTSYAYTGFSVSLVAAANPAALAGFAAAYRVQSMGRQMLYPFRSALQHWIVSDDAQEVRRRVRMAILITTLAGLIVAAGMAILLPMLDVYLFSHAVSVSRTSAALAGSSLLAISAAMSLASYYMIPHKLTSSVANATTIGAALGIPAIFLTANTHGVDGATAAIASIEFTVLLIQAASVLRHARQMRQHDAKVKSHALSKH